MTAFQAIILGIIQGLTEFLPVSSSGHLVLAQEIMGLNLEGGSLLFFDLMMHLGTLAAVISVWHKDIFGLFKKPKEIGLLALASLPALVVVILFGDQIDALFAGGKYLCFLFLFTAILLAVTEIIIKKKGERQKDVNVGGAAVIGLAQAAAIFPGLSRSGATISAALLYGVEKEKAARFSFLMSIVVIGGGAAVQLIKVIQGGSLAGIEAGNVILGMLAAALTGFLSVKLFIKAVGKINFKWFSLYLLALSVVMFINYFGANPIW